MPKHRIYSKLDENILQRHISFPIQFLTNKTLSFINFIKNKINNQDEKIARLENRIKVLETLLIKDVLEN